MMPLRRGVNKHYDWPIDQIVLWLAEGKTHAKIGELLGKDPKQVSKFCKANNLKSQRRGPRSGPGHPDWNGGIHYDKSGYRLVWVGEDDPMSVMARKRGNNRRNGYGYVPEHRLVMARYLGRTLERGEVVHHKNGIRDDNRIENLELFSSNGEHLRHELAGHCPKWSEDGKRRILEGRAKWVSNRKALESDEQESNQNIPRLTEDCDKS